MHEFTTGEVIGEDFEIIEEIKRGGMGIVYRGKQRSLNRDVCVKIPIVDFPRLQLEIAAIAKLDHPSIVRIYTAGTHREIPYFVMEFIEGKPLSSFLGNGRVGVIEAAKFGVSVTQALKHAWTRHKVIHRDVKPSNILYSANGTLKF